MRKATSIALLAALPGLLMASPVFAGSTRADDEQLRANDNHNHRCRVRVFRNSPSDTWDVSRQELRNHDCVCLVRTGPDTQSDRIEQRIVDLLRDRDCSGAAPFIAGWGGATTGTTVAGTSGVVGGATGTVAAAGTAGTIGAAAGTAGVIGAAGVTAAGFSFAWVMPALLAAFAGLGTALSTGTDSPGV